VERKSKNVGELLVINNRISQSQLVEAMEFQRSNGGRLSNAIIKKGFMREDELTRFMGENFKMTPVKLDQFVISRELTKLVPENIARKHNVIPIQLVGDTLIVAISDPTNKSLMDELRFYTKKKIKPVLSGEMAITKAIDKAYLVSEKMDEIIKSVKISTDETGIELTARKAIDVTRDDGSPIVKFVNSMILEAIKVNASDIHIEGYQHSLRIRFRVDGVLYEQIRPPTEIRNQLISRMKIMSELDIAEKRVPQDGRFKVRLPGGGREIEFRVSTTPCVFGEKIVLRIIDDANLAVDMTILGFEPSDLKVFKSKIHYPKGLILVTGPTGSGKTQTLYSALLELNTEGRNISTAEDPVEFNIEGLNQVWVKEDIGHTFASTHKSFLRQDPDIMMIGEIRDLETAETAIKAALTGHLVFSTLHTNDAPSTINRILDMGVEPFNLMAALELVVAQRLARRICPRCKEETKFSPAEMIRLGVPANLVTGLKVYKGRGCSHCSNTGYKGRIGVFEVLNVTEDLKEIILRQKGVSSDEVRQEAVRLGMTTLRSDGINKFVRGLIDIDEVVRVTAQD